MPLQFSVLAAASALVPLLPSASSFSSNSASAMRDAAHITANAGDSIVFNCGVQVSQICFILIYQVLKLFLFI